MSFPGRLTSLLQPQNNWLERQQNTIMSAATIITVATVGSSLFGLLRQRLLIDIFFKTNPSGLEAFLIAFQIPDTIFQLLIIGALSSAFIPIFTKYKKNSEEMAFTMSSIMMNVLLLIFVVVSVVIFVFAKPITDWRTGDAFSPEQIEIVTNLTRVMLFSQFFFAISNFLTGILQSFQRFIVPSLAPIFYNLGIMFGVYFFHESMGIYSAGLGVIIGAFLHLIIQLPLVYKLGFRYKFSFDLKFDGISEFFRMMPPRVLSLSASEIRKHLLGFFATSLTGNFSVVVIQNGLTLMTLPIRYFGVPISQATLPFMADKSNERDLHSLRDLVIRSLHQIAFFALPMSVLLLILRIPIVRLAFGSKDFPWETTILTGKVVAILALSILAQSLVPLLTRTFHALRDTRTPLLIALFDVGLYLIINALLVFGTDWGVLGLAVATSVTAVVELLLFVAFLNRKLGGLGSKAFWIPQLKMILASFLMGVFAYLPYKFLDTLVFDTSRTIELIGLTITSSTIGLLVYIYFAALLDIHELQMLVDMASKFGPWRAALKRTDEVLVDTSVESDDF